MFGWLKRPSSSKGSRPRSPAESRPNDMIHAKPLPTDPFATLRDQVAIVTGSTSRIGLALAESLAERGVKVALNGLGDAAASEEARSGLEARAGAAVRYHRADMTDPAAIAARVRFAHTEFRRLDILVNNAGIQHV